MGSNPTSFKKSDRNAKEDGASDQPLEEPSPLTPRTTAGTIKDTQRRLDQGQHSQTATPTNVSVIETKTQVPLREHANVSTVLIDQQAQTSLTSAVVGEGVRTTGHSKRKRKSATLKRRHGELILIAIYPLRWRVS